MKAVRFIKPTHFNRATNTSDSWAIMRTEQRTIDLLTLWLAEVVPEIFPGFNMQQTSESFFINIDSYEILRPSSDKYNLVPLMCKIVLRVLRIHTQTGTNISSSLWFQGGENLVGHKGYIRLKQLGCNPARFY